MTQTEISENLKAAGCSPSEVQILVDSFAVCDAEEKSRLIAKQRSRILENLHKCEYELNCIDYLAYKMRQAAVNGE